MGGLLPGRVRQRPRPAKMEWYDDGGTTNIRLLSLKSPQPPLPSALAIARFSSSSLLIQSSPETFTDTLSRPPKMSNSTAPPYTSTAMLYADTDFSKLTWLELQWAYFYIWIDNPIIATGLMSFLLHEVLYIASPDVLCLRHRVYVAASSPIFLHVYRSYTLVVASRGSLSTQFRTSGDGSCSPTRSPRSRSSGNVRSRFCSVTSPSSCLL